MTPCHRLILWISVYIHVTVAILGIGKNKLEVQGIALENRQHVHTWSHLFVLCGGHKEKDDEAVAVHGASETPGKAKRSKEQSKARIRHD